jgi:hypothetical protein
MLLLSMGLLMAGCSPDAAPQSEAAKDDRAPRIHTTTGSDTMPSEALEAEHAAMRRNHVSIFMQAVSAGMPSGAVLLLVRTDDQAMDMLVEQTTITRFAVSTSKFGIGSEADSNRTPLGLHRVVERFGDGKPLGSVFKSRRATGEVISPEQWHGPSDEDYVLTRILRLRGVEEGRNAGPRVDSYQRCIYIHGTNEENRLGKPASHGCIRMANRDVADLFGAVAGRETWCLIVDAKEMRKWLSL